MTKKSFRVIFFILFLISAVVTVKHLFSVFSFYNDVDKNIYNHAETVTEEGKNLIQSHLQKIETLLNDFAAQLSQKDYSIDELKEILESKLKATENISGIGIVNKKNAAMPSTAQLSSIYATNNNNIIEFLNIENFYDYSDNSIEWYNKSISGASGIFIPYYDKMNKSFVIPVAAPIYKNNNSQNKKIDAILICFISMNDIRNLVSTLDFGSKGYGILTLSDGTVIMHPRENFIFKNFKNIVKDKYKKENYLKIEEIFKSQKKDLIEEFDFNTNTKKIITFIFVPKLNGFFGAILNKMEFGFPFIKAKKILMKLTLYISLTLTFLFISIALKLLDEDDKLTAETKLNEEAKKVEEANKTETEKKENEKDYKKKSEIILVNPVIMKKLFTYSLTLTAILIISVCYLWYLQRYYGLSAPQNSAGFLSDKSSINKFIESDKKYIQAQKTKEFLYIPVGMLVQSIKILGINEAEVSGIVWQKIKSDLLGKFKEGIRFPDAISTNLEEIYRTVDSGGNVTIGWNFKSILRMNFDNTLYPFELLDLKVIITPKNVLDRVQFIPDLTSFDEYSSISNSFVSKSMIVSGWEVKQTYFSTNKIEYSTTFGQLDSQIKNNVRTLVLNISLQREFLTNFFSTFLQFYVLLLLGFIALLFTSGIEEKSKVYSFKPSNMQGVASGFLLFLIFSIVNIRTKAISNSILYVEYLYFFLCIVLLMLVLTTVHICKQKKSILGYKDGLIVKVSYWPVVMIVTLLITYFHFK